jgi:hypothetical protein
MLPLQTLQLPESSIHDQGEYYLNPPIAGIYFEFPPLPVA